MAYITNRLSGKRLVREKTPGKRLSGKMTIRESYYAGNDCKPPGPNNAGQFR